MTTKPTIPNTVSPETAKRLEDARKAAGVEWPIEFSSGVYIDDDTGNEFVIHHLEGGRITCSLFDQEIAAPNVAELLGLLPYSSHRKDPDGLAYELMGWLGDPKTNHHWAEEFPLKKIRKLPA